MGGRQIFFALKMLLKKAARHEQTTTVLTFFAFKLTGSSV
jgi:hypothetical protein